MYDHERKATNDIVEELKRQIASFKDSLIRRNRTYAKSETAL